MLVFSDATFRDLPTSMETESSNGKEGVVLSTYLAARLSANLRILPLPLNICFLTGGGSWRLRGCRRSHRVRRWGEWQAAGGGGAAVRPVHEVVHCGHVRHRHGVCTDYHRHCHHVPPRAVRPMDRADCAPFPQQDLPSLHDQLCVPLQRVPSQRQHILSQKTSQ